MVQSGLEPVASVGVGRSQVDLARHCLVDAHGTPVPLRPRAWQVLRVLALNAGRVVGKNELLDAVWSDCVVTEDSLVQAIGDVRRALGPQDSSALRTLPRRGYMLVASHPLEPMPVNPGLRLGDRLRADAARHFVGRIAELALLRESIAPVPSCAAVTFLHGPGGIGKSTLLLHLHAEAEALGLSVVSIDAADVQPTPEGLLSALARSAGCAGGAAGATLAALVSALSTAGRGLLVIDSFEYLEPASVWIRDDLLPALPAQWSVVLAGRQAPDSHWQAHPAWRDALRCLALASLSADESAELLQGCGVAPTSHAAALALCHGHPLTLSLLGAEVARNGQVPAELGFDLVRTLTQRCVAQAPTPLHRAALELSGRVLNTTQVMLAEVVDADAAAGLFDWLSRQSFVRNGQFGLVPHDLVRDAIDEELRWRDPPASARLTRAISQHLIRQMQAPNSPTDPWRMTVELNFLERHHPVMRRFFDYSSLGSIPVSPATAADADGIARLRDNALPPGQRALFDHWARHAATRMWVAHRAGRQVCGVTQMIRLDEVDDASANYDALVAQVRRALRLAPHRPAEQTAPLAMMLTRFTLPEGERRGKNPAMNALQLAQYWQWAAATGLGVSVLAVIHPDHFAPLFARVRFSRMADCEALIDGLPMGCFMHDWQAEPWGDWFEHLS